MLDRTALQSGETASARGSGPIEALLRFDRGGGRAVLSRQYVPYPFHATRPFYLDRERPDLATLYLQSASGGIYRGDRLALTMVVGAKAAVHVTTQASTIVHRTDRDPAAQRSRIEVEPGGFAAVTLDPLVLFPGSAIVSTTEIVMRAGAHIIVADGFAHHDPSGVGRPFDRYEGSILVWDEGGALLMAERGAITGDRFAASTSPLGPYRAVGTLLVLGPRAQNCDAERIESLVAACGCLAGLSRLPNNCGIGGRVLATNGGALARGLEAGFAVAFAAILGVAPAGRRK